MKSQVRSILHGIESSQNIEHIRRISAESKGFNAEDLNKAYRILERNEEEKYKSEDQKNHERFVRKNKKMSHITHNLPIREGRPEIKKPGLEFEGNLRFLAEKYKTIDEIFKHMTCGQLLRWYVVEDKVYRMKDNKLAYIESTREILLDN